MKWGSMANLPPQDFHEEGEKKDGLDVCFTMYVSTDPWAGNVILIRTDTMKALCHPSSAWLHECTFYYRNVAVGLNTLTLWYIRTKNPVAQDIWPQCTGERQKGSLCNSRLNAHPKGHDSTKTFRYTQLFRPCILGPGLSPVFPSFYQWTLWAERECVWNVNKISLSGTVDMMDENTSIY